MSDLWIETYTGERFDILKYTAEDIRIEDIAHSLSLTCRYTGHCKYHYSVAQHSMLVASIIASDYLPLIKSKADQTATLLLALLHDATEAYLGDMVVIKWLVPQIKEIEAKLDGVIQAKFKTARGDAGYVREADMIALAVEASNLMKSGGKDWPILPKVKPNDFSYLVYEEEPSVMEAKFLTYYHQLMEAK